jgi:hypothetical protein
MAALDKNLFATDRAFNRDNYAGLLWWWILWSISARSAGFNNAGKHVDGHHWLRVG